MQGEPIYTGLTVDVLRDDTLGLYVFGVNVDDAFIPIASERVGTMDDALSHAADERKAREDRERASAAAEPAAEPTPTPTPEPTPAPQSHPEQ